MDGSSKPADSESIPTAEVDHKSHAVFRRRKSRCLIGPKRKSKAVLSVRSTSLDGSQHCCFCLQGSEKSDECGELKTINDLSVHRLCAYFASNLEQKQEEDVDFWGFLVEDIRKECSRGSGLKCRKCNGTRAVVGCSARRCRNSFHFPCALAEHGLPIYRDNFALFCRSHRPKQELEKLAEELLHNGSLEQQERVTMSDGSTVTRANKSEALRSLASLTADCPICCNPLHLTDGLETVHGACCRHAFFHRTCIQQYARKAGLHHFACPFCRDQQRFAEELMNFGIEIPATDAEWEKEPDAYADLLQRPSSCEAYQCVNPAGRNDLRDDRRPKAKFPDFALLNCSLCGHHAAHRLCAAQTGCPSALRCENAQWICNDCVNLDVAHSIRSKSASAAPRRNSQPPSKRSRVSKQTAKDVKLRRSARFSTASEANDLVVHSPSLSSASQLPSATVSDYLPSQVKIFDQQFDSKSQHCKLDSSASKFDVEEFETNSDSDHDEQLPMRELRVVNPSQLIIIRRFF